MTIPAHAACVSCVKALGTLHAYNVTIGSFDGCIAPRWKYQCFQIAPNKKNKQTTQVIGNDVESIHSFFISARKGGWNGRGQCPNSRSTTPYTQVSWETKKTCLVNNQCSLSFYPLFNTNSVQIKIELVAQRARGPGRGVEGVLGSVRQLRKNEQHRKAHSLCSKTTAMQLFLITINEALEGKHAIKTLLIT